MSGHWTARCDGLAAISPPFNPCTDGDLSQLRANQVTPENFGVNRNAVLG